VTFSPGLPAGLAAALLALDALGWRAVAATFDRERHHRSANGEPNHGADRRAG
jgi:hypothetical protein